MSPGTRIYADYNATAPLRPEAREAVLRVLEGVGNASSVHAEGRKARGLVEGARETVAAAIGACRDDIAFVSGGTEAVQAPIWGALDAMTDGESLLASRIEHDAIIAIVEYLRGKTGEAKAWPTAVSPDAWAVRADGQVDLDWLRGAMKDAASVGGVRPLVSLMLVNNETGVIQPVAEVAEIVHTAGGLIHCDAIQGLGKVEVSVIELDVDYLSLSAHKIGGPQGVGAFYVKPGAPFKAVQTGGGQEFGRRAGTENVAGIAGFAAAADAALHGLSAYQALAQHRDRMEQKIRATAPTLQIHGENAQRVAGVSCFGVEGLPSETQIMGLDLAGLAVSAGSACSSGKVKPSRVLTAMGLSEAAAKSAIRASLGWASDWRDFDALAEAWIRMAARARPNLVKADVHV